MGLVAILATLSIKWAGITGLDDNRALFLIVVPALARGSLLFGFRFLPYGRPEGGTGFDFFERKPGFAAFRGLALVIVLTFSLGWQAIWLLLCFAGITAGLVAYYRRRMGCITGDMLGAMTEINEAGLFLLASMGGQI
jgi:adenosylcobinamide-GDP ribazoletransferase